MRRTRGSAGGELLDVIKHADVSGCLLWGHNRGSRRQHCKAKEHERPYQHGAVRSIAREHDHDMLAVELFLGCFEQRDERLT